MRQAPRVRLPACHALGPAVADEVVLAIQEAMTNPIRYSRSSQGLEVACTSMGPTSSRWSKTTASVSISAQGVDEPGFDGTGGLTVCAVKRNVLPRGAETVVALLASHAAEGIILTTPNGAVSYVNERMAEMLGHPPVELLGKRAADCAAAGDATGGQLGHGEHGLAADGHEDCRLTQCDGREPRTSLLTPVAP